MTEPASLVFVVGSGVQLDSAQRVAHHLQREAAALDIWRGVIAPLSEVAVPGHLAPVSLARLRAVAAVTSQWANSVRDGILVTPQDVGLVYRRAIAAARRAGAKIAFLPDGAVSAGKVTGRSLLGGLVPVADSVLRSIGLVAGRHGHMAASRPDLVLSWGSAWNEVYRARGVQNIIDVGNPRSDDLAELPPPAEGKILLCSQPMNSAAIGGAATESKWYEFLDRIATSAPPGILKIRLHPAEKDRLGRISLHPTTRALITETTSLSEDIAWSGAVVSWASTTMIEAAGARRPVVSVAINEAAAQVARGYFFQRDPRAICVLTDELPDFAALEAVVTKARDQQAGMAEDYLVNIGSAAKTAAQALDEM